MSTKTDLIIIDYGLGNLKSVERAVIAAGGKPKISDNPKDVLNASKLILPGVGAFEAGMEGLRQRHLIEPLHQKVSSGTPLLGLCLGMQLLFETSEEFGQHQGLGFVKGTVDLLKPIQGDTTFKIPHIGWNSLEIPQQQTWHNTVLEKVKPGEMVYFVHSYIPFPSNSEDSLATTEYGGVHFTSVVKHANVQGTQFHPEKSADVGQKILKSFLNT
jgi:imidazole glycerol-phosphate synthase subunit HisH